MTVLSLHDPSTAQGYYRAGLWRPETFYSLICRHALETPDAFALRDRARRLTWRELKALTDSTAATLHAAGVARGQRVAVWLPDRIESVLILLACARNGYLCNPSLHLSYTGDEVIMLLRQTRARVLVAEVGYGATDAPTLKAISRLPHMGRIFTLERGRGSDGSIAAGEAPLDDAPAAVSNPDKVFYLAFTSGTTGTPKGVLHSDNTLLANARDLIQDWGHDRGTVLLTLSPLSHHIAWVAASQVLVCGGELVLNDPPSGSTALDWMAETGATCVMGVPTHGMDILADQRRRGIARLGRVKVFYMAGAPIPRTVAASFLEQGITPQNVYGMTENSSHQYTHPDDSPETICGTCGRGGRSYAVKIVRQDKPDVEVEPGEVGQIAGNGACLMLGYFDNQQATEESFNRDGLFLSGDLGRFDEQGNLVIVGRIKDVIIRGGHNIHPARIEELAVMHPSIDKAAAFGVPDERLGEKVGLAILTSGDATPTGETVLDHLFEQGLSRYDMPEYYIVMDEFPLTASGKILKRQLAEWTRNGRITPSPVRFVPPDRRGS